MNKNPDGKLSDILQKKFDEDISKENNGPIGTDNMSCIIIKWQTY